VRLFESGEGCCGWWGLGVATGGIWWPTGGCLVAEKGLVG